MDLFEFNKIGGDKMFNIFGFYKGVQRTLMDMKRLL